MNIIFKKIILHNFGSFGDAEISLANRGFCLVSGQNKCSTDNALSNGAGKSFIGSAICYTLTGETINGLRTNLKNINTESTDCYTTLDFKVDNDNYLITRFHKPKSDLKILKNDIDISGKGIKESEQILATILPDLTKDLIASTIIIGQGMPNKFSAFSPAGRKELLEKLTKSDFMIDDIKARLNKRVTELNQQLRVQEDSLLVHSTQMDSINAQLKIVEADLNNYVIKDYAAEITEVQTKLTQNVTQQQIVKQEIEGLNTQYDQFNAKLLQVTQNKAQVNAEELQNYVQVYNEINQNIQTITAKLSTLKAEIKRLQAITDICPTCGQKLKNVQKPDTTKQEKEAEEYQKQLDQLTSERLVEIKTKHAQYLEQIEQQFKEELQTLQTNVSQTKILLSEKQKILDTLITSNQTLNNEYSKLTYLRDNEQQRLNNLKLKRTELQENIQEEINLIKLCAIAKDELNAHLEVLKRIETLIKRDFRGYLLSNIIDFINKKAKEYAKIVFKNDKLEIYLDGNALEITYANKNIGALSGGERTRVDLIIQFAIRDMLNTYLSYSSNLIILDEITDYLDYNSCQAVLNLISTGLQDLDSIFIISHHTAELQLPVDSELVVIKNENGISSVQE